MNGLLAWLSLLTVPVTDERHGDQQYILPPASLQDHRRQFNYNPGKAAEGQARYGQQNGDLNEWKKTVENLLLQDQLKCLLLTVCEEAVTDTLNKSKVNINEVMHSFHFIFKNVASLQSELGFSPDDDKLNSMKAFARAASIGTNSKDYAACAAKFPRCPADRTDREDMKQFLGGSTAYQTQQQIRGSPQAPVKNLILRSPNTYPYAPQYDYVKKKAWIEAAAQTQHRQNEQLDYGYHRDAVADQQDRLRL